MSRRLVAVALTLGALGLGACTTPARVPDSPTSTPTTTTPSASAASASPRGGPRSTAADPGPSTEPSAIVEPTTTNTLPPPPRPSRPAPTRAGELTAESLPVPAGWRTTVRAGGSEEGFQGNGTWVHARDPRYAAHDVITLGCADVTRDDYPDPVAALEGTYARGRRPGIGLVLQFGSGAKAEAFWNVYLRQVRACQRAGGPVRTAVTRSPLGLIDRRTYPDGSWTEVGTRRGERVTLVILADGSEATTRAESEALLRRIAAG